MLLLYQTHQTSLGNLRNSELGTQNHLSPQSSILLLALGPPESPMPRTTTATERTTRVTRRSTDVADGPSRLYSTKNDLPRRAGYRSSSC